MREERGGMGTRGEHGDNGVQKRGYGGAREAHRRPQEVAQGITGISGDTQQECALPLVPFGHIFKFERNEENYFIRVCKTHESMSL